jgi:hypothetical protein
MSLPIKAELLIDLGNWQRGLSKASKQMSGFGKSMKTIANGVKAAFITLGASVLTGFIGQWIEAAEQARQADQRLDQVAKTINIFGKNLPNVTKRLKEFAEQQEIVTGVTAEEIKAAQTKILTYSAVGKSAGKLGGIFDRTTMAAIDLAATGFGSVESNADTLGKALANPLKGLQALTRQGFTYTEKQKKQFAVWIKQGKLYKAQSYILKDIESQVKGVAEASGSSMAKLSNAFGQITDEIGAQFLPMLDKMVKWFQSSEGKKAIQVWIDKINEIGAYFNSPEFAKGLDEWVKRIEGLLKFIGSLLDGLNEFLDNVTGNSDAKRAWEDRRAKWLENQKRMAQERKTPEYQQRALKIAENNKELAAAQNVNITINAPNTSGNAVLEALKQTARRRGVPLKLLLD